MHSLLLSETEIEKIKTWNGTVQLAKNVCVDDIIQRQCQNQPDSLAITAWDGSLTYSQLDDLSSRLSSVLVQKGVKPQDFVPLCFEKSLWAMVAVFAVIKAGGAFVFLDPSFPEVRLRQICHRVASQLVVASEKQAGLAKSLSSNTLLVGANSDWAKYPPRANRTTVTRAKSHTPQDPLYAVFTSGTTGQPKGIVTEHRSFATSMSALSPLIGLGPGARLLQSAAYLWDTCVLEIFAPLMVGACVCIPSQHQLDSGFEQAFRDFRVTHAGLTPTLARTIRPDNVPDLHALVLWGEQMTHTDVAQWRGSVRLMNGYGPAECSVISTIQCDISVLVDNPSNFGTGTAAGTWIVDPNNHDRLMNIGEVGELVIEGPIVGRGYLNDVAATKEAFIDPPWWRLFFDGSPVNSFYKTGDLVRYCKDGSLESVGRKDLQVKLRGQRVDLKAIEHLLRQTSALVRDVVVEPVTLHTGSNNNNVQLAAFVFYGRHDEYATNTEQQPLITIPNSEFHAWVQSAGEDLAHLPNHMMPAAFFRVTEIPRTLSSKVDRAQLRDVVSQLSISDLRELGVLPANASAPKSTAELRLQQVVSEVLGIPVGHIGLDDTFSGLGGDSIAAMQVVSLCREFDIVLPMENVTQCKTLSELVAGYTKLDESCQHEKEGKVQCTKESTVPDESRSLVGASGEASTFAFLYGAVVEVIVRMKLFIALFAILYIARGLLDLE